MLRRTLATVTAATAFVAGLVVSFPGFAQVQRNFPQNALRGVIVFGAAPEVALNGNAARLAPGARIRDPNNLSIVPSGVLGGRFLVHYTVDPLGLVKDVWILTAPEASKSPWPTTPEQAATWIFDPAAQAWAKP